MLGYVKCNEGELLVKHHRLYGASYCGLCHSIRVIGARSLLPFFSYDFVFLALFRSLVIGENNELERDFCLLHPFRKNKQRLAHNPTMAYAAFCALLLTREKMQDDRLDGDSPFFRRLLVSAYLPLLKRAEKRQIKKHPELSALSRQITSVLAEGRALEKRGASLDEMCSNFAACLSLLFSFGTEGREQKFLFGIGDLLGRFLYTLDALDDREKDLKSGAFNPILKNGALPDEGRLCELDLVLAFYVDEMRKILDLVDGDPNVTAICENIICSGLPGAVRKIIKPKMGENE